MQGVQCKEGAARATEAGPRFSYQTGWQTGDRRWPAGQDAALGQAAALGVHWAQASWAPHHPLPAGCQSQRLDPPAPCQATAAGQRPLPQRRPQANAWCPADHTGSSCQAARPLPAALLLWCVGPAVADPGAVAEPQVAHNIAAAVAAAECLHPLRSVAGSQQWRQHLH